MKKLVLGIILSSASFGTFAHDTESDNTGWMVGAGVGIANLSIEPKYQPGYVSSDRSPELFTVFGGFKFRDWFGIEFDVSKSAEFEDENVNHDAYIVGTSFTPKFTHHFNGHSSAYFKLGLQYLSYVQKYGGYYDSERRWSGIEPFLGVGFQHSFGDSIKARADYKYAKFSLERRENNWYYDDFYVDDIDLTFSALTFSVHYQF